MPCWTSSPNRFSRAHFQAVRKSNFSFRESTRGEEQSLNTYNSLTHRHWHFVLKGRFVCIQEEQQQQIIHTIVFDTILQITPLDLCVEWLILLSMVCEIAKWLRNRRLTQMDKHQFLKSRRRKNVCDYRWILLTGFSRERSKEGGESCKVRCEKCETGDYPFSLDANIDFSKLLLLHHSQNQRKQKRRRKTSRKKIWHLPTLPPLEKRKVEPLYSHS